MQRTHLWIGAAAAGIAIAAAAVDSLGGEAAITAPAAPEGSAKDGMAASVDIKDLLRHGGDQRDRFQILRHQ